MFLLSPLLTIALSLTSISALNCRCTSGSGCWPSDSEFQILASKVSQPLIRPIPPATPCYDPTTGSCTEVIAGWSNSTWRSDQPGAAEFSNYETYTFPNGTIQGCYLNTTLGIPCEQGSVSVIGVDARTTEDIQEAIGFARKHNLRFVIKSTGHDFLGRSSGRDSFLIWTHHMKEITFHDSFSPTGATDSVTYDNVFTFAAGVQWFEAHEAARQHNREIVGAGRLSVATSGGWLAGGGHSGISPAYGLGVDNVLEIAIVTADGKHIIANPYQNEDLFWALRGGGGGTWGIVTSATYKTHPSKPLSSALIFVNSTNAESTQNLLAEIIRLTPLLAEQGYGGYGGASASQIVLLFTSPNVTVEQNQAIFLPLFEFAASQPGLSLVENYTAVYQDSWSWSQTISIIPGNVVGVTEVSSWLLPGDIFETDRPGDLAAELLKIKSAFGYFLVAGGQVSRVDPDSMGLNPAWRNGLALIYISRTWREGANLTEIEAARQLLIEDMKTLEGIAPESGAYFNEASRYEFDWKKSFFGTHYDKLRAIKQRWDPDSMFVVHESIGSDEWDAELVCRL